GQEGGADQGPGGALGRSQESGPDPRQEVLRRGMPAGRATRGPPPIAPGRAAPAPGANERKARPLLLAAPPPTSPPTVFFLFFWRQERRFLGGLSLLWRT